VLKNWLNYFFCGPLQDPLNLELGMDVNYKRLDILCEDAATGSGDWKGKQLTRYNNPGRTIGTVFG